MADPLSISASALAVITAAIQSSKSLYETVKRFKDRHKTLRRLLDELEDLATILDSLERAVNKDTSMLALLHGPISRCSQVCLEFERLMKAFSTKSTTGFLDWTKLEFMKGDINEFIDTISGYKSTILVGLGTINMHTSKVSHQALQDYNEMIQDTAYNLKIHLQRIDDKLERNNDSTNSTDRTSTSDLNLNDERAVTEECLRICNDAISFIEILRGRESSLLREAPQNAASDATDIRFEAHSLTHQALDENRDNFANISNRLRERLETLLTKDGHGSEDDRSQLQLDIDISKQCLEVCTAAKEFSKQKSYKIGEAVADDESDQVVVTTLADLFDIQKIVSKGNSAQLIGSMDSESLRNLTDKRYSSRFGSVVLSKPMRIRNNKGATPSTSEDVKMSSRQK